MVHTIVPPYSQFVHGGQSNFLFDVLFLASMQNYDIPIISSKQIPSHSVSFNLFFEKMRQNETKTCGKKSIIPNPPVGMPFLPKRLRPRLQTFASPSANDMVFSGKL